MQKSIWPVIIAIIVTAVIASGGTYLWQSGKISMPKNMEFADTIAEGTTIEEGYSYNPGELPGFTSLKEGNFISIDKKALAKLYVNDEQIESFYIPENPADTTTVFISTSGETEGEWPSLKSVNKIYSYNIKTSEMVKLYEELENRLLRTMGISGSKLILMYDMIDNSPGPCSSVWVGWDFGYLELADTNSGLQKYTMPEYQIEKGKAEQLKCEKEL